MTSRNQGLIPRARDSFGQHRDRIAGSRVESNDKRGKGESLGSRLRLEKFISLRSLRSCSFYIAWFPYNRNDRSLTLIRSLFVVLKIWTIKPSPKSVLKITNTYFPVTSREKILESIFLFFAKGINGYAWSLMGVTRRKISCLRQIALLINIKNAWVLTVTVKIDQSEDIPESDIPEQAF